MIRAGAVIAAVAAALSTLACGGAAARVAAVADASDAITLAVRSGMSQQADAATRAAHAAAALQVDGALQACDPSGDALLREAFLDRAAHEDIEAASLIAWFWQPRLEDPEAYVAWLYVLRRSGRRALAEELAWQAAVDDAVNRATWMRQWYAALAADADRFAGPVLGVTRGAQLSELRPFRGHSSIIFKAVRNGEIVGVFKPHQDLRHQSYRGEVAAYRLCQLIRCTFTVPGSREMAIEEGEFRALAGVGPRDDLHFGSRRSLVFAREDRRRMLYGVYKEWMPEFTGFPVEYTDVWSPLVRVGVTEEGLRARSLVSAVAGLRTRPRGGYDRIAALAGDATAYDLARHLSEVHVYDVLINNFDRYQPEWYGMNAHFAASGLLSIDNGASFSLPEEFSWSAARRRVERVQVFSRSMIDAIRWMDDEMALALLFRPDPNFDDDRERFEAMTTRRQWLLDYVDELVARHGEEAVYVFP